MGWSTAPAASVPTTTSAGFFDEPAEFVAAAIDLLADGLLLGQRLVYVNDGPPARVHDDLGALGPVDDLMASGRLVVLPLEAYCDPSVGVTPDLQLTFCDHQVAETVHDGFTGCGSRPR